MARLRVLTLLSCCSVSLWGERGSELWPSPLVGRLLQGGQDLQHSLAWLLLCLSAGWAGLRTPNQAHYNLTAVQKGHGWETCLVPL